MTTMTARFRSIPGTEAAVGWAGTHTVVADRPEGKAGGQGLGFNGGRLLALAIGGCFCNALRYVSYEMGIHLTSVQVDVTVTHDPDLDLITDAALRAEVTADDNNADINALIKRAQETTTIGNSVRRGIPLKFAA
jgi:organic hydroperoxide reductase OsmC/OhrA